MNSRLGYPLVSCFLIGSQIGNLFNVLLGFSLNLFRVDLNCNCEEVLIYLYEGNSYQALHHILIVSSSVSPLLFENYSHFRLEELIKCVHLTALLDYEVKLLQVKVLCLLIGQAGFAIVVVPCHDPDASDVSISD